MTVIRYATVLDIDAMLTIEQRSSQAAHWPRETYLHALTQGARLVLIAEEGGTMEGFLIASRAADEWELENIAVTPERRRQGVGRALMAELISQAKQAHALEIRQEIRASNLAAQTLGRSMGFEPEGRRPAYYSNPTEEALLFKYLLQKTKFEAGESDMSP